MVIAEAIAFSIMIFAVAAAARWVIKSATNSKIQLSNAEIKNRIEADLLERLDEARPTNYGARRDNRQAQ